LITKTGETLPGEGLILYLPAGSRLAYVVNDWTVDLHRRNRKLAFRLGLCNLLLVLLSLIIFYGNPDRGATNVALHLLLAMSWIAVPFMVLFVALVAPIDRLLKAFPSAKSIGSGSRHISRVFELAV
jgi:hypothetical protein